MLEVVGLSKCFKTKTVLSNVTFTIPTTGIHGLIGANGAGKTTTMKLLLGLLAPDEGTITFNGERVKPHQNAMTPSIGYLPDVPQFYGYLTAAEYLLLCGELAGQSPAERNQTTQTLLKKSRLGETGNPANSRVFAWDETTFRHSPSACDTTATTHL